MASFPKPPKGYLGATRYDDLTIQQAIQAATQDYNTATTTAAKRQAAIYQNELIDWKTANYETPATHTRPLSPSSDKTEVGKEEQTSMSTLDISTATTADFGDFIPSRPPEAKLKASHYRSIVDALTKQGKINAKATPKMLLRILAKAALQIAISAAVHESDWDYRVTEGSSDFTLHDLKKVLDTLTPPVKNRSTSGPQGVTMRQFARGFKKPVFEQIKAKPADPSYTPQLFIKYQTELPLRLHQYKHACLDILSGEEDFLDDFEKETFEACKRLALKTSRG